MSIWLLLFVILYLTINYFWSKSIYKKSEIFYKNKEVNDGHPIKDIHERYSVFRRYDRLSFNRIFLGMTFLFWWRMVLAIGLALIYGTLLRYDWNNFLELLLSFIHLILILRNVVLLKKLQLSVFMVYLKFPDLLFIKEELKILT